MFTCMSCRAVHTEITHSLDTDSFKLALRRLIPTIGNAQTIFSDNGSNFICSGNELRRALEEMTRRNFIPLCKHHVVNGLLGKGALLLPSIWVVFGSVRSVQPAPSFLPLMSTHGR